jgi:hypothetical protein
MAQRLSLVRGSAQCCLLHFDAVTELALPLGIPATGRARTLIDVAARRQFVDAVALVDAALRRSPELVGELDHERARRLPRRGRAEVERVLDFASPLSESVLESHARVLWAEANLPPAVQQAVIRVDGRFVARVDFLWPAHRLVVEVDALSKYSERNSLQDEKARQNALVTAGYTVLRFTWRDITERPGAVVLQVRSALARASA